MRIAIIGASGYTGAKITVEALARGHEVSAIVRYTGSRRMLGSPLPEAMPTMR
jgi:putative NADH-flavin reductase